ncbi:ribosomal protein S5-alanine N-acetyltransferase [Vibrio sonorensis]|uniref:ribosomal protein S5-alanine N-acetyltransferase n=1 Tax=Vibrio sonorensis TaxID=1004316 RepID=UPI0008D9B1AE
MSLSNTTQVYEEDKSFVLRTAEPSDAEMILDYFIDNRDHLMPWEPKRPATFYTLEDWQQKLVKLHELHRMGLAYYLIIVDKQCGQMLGTVSFSNITRYPFHACNMGYSLAETAQGKGIMTRAIKLAVAYMFEHQNLHRIMAGYLPRNVKSGAVLQRLGFKEEGLAEDYLLINGKWEDHVLTSLVNSKWKEKQ